MKKRVFIIALSGVLAISSFAMAHSGRTDSKGGHYNRKTGEYHYHSGGTSSGGSGSRATAAPRATTAPRATATPEVLIPRTIMVPDELLPKGSDLFFGKTNKAGVYLRESNASTSKLIGNIRTKGTAFEILESIEGRKLPWYKIWYNDMVAYIYSEHVDLISEEEYLAGK